MQKIEKWRVEELVLVLSELADLLRMKNQPEWANVFAHYQFEASRLLIKNPFDLPEIKNLLKNIRYCFSSIDTSHSSPFSSENQRTERSSQAELLTLRNRLIRIIDEMESRIREYIH